MIIPSTCLIIHYNSHVLCGHRHRRPGAGFGLDTAASSGYGFDDDTYSDGEDGADRISDLQKRYTYMAKESTYDCKTFSSRDELLSKEWQR